jgi:branched-chain amino acid transport system substrate-binding protein
MTLTSRLLIAAAALLVGGTAHAEVRGITDKEIILGASIALTGNLASSGQGHSLGIRIAIEDVNSKGGINGRQLRLILEDDAYVPARTVQNIRKLIDVDKIFALMAMSSSAGALASIDYITETNTININSYIMNTVIWEKFRPTTFSIGQGYPELAARVVRYINGKIPDAKWGVFVQDDPFGENILVGVNQAMKDSKGTSVEVIKFKRGQQDFSSEILRMKAAGVNAIYAAGVFNEYLAFAREAKRVGLEVQFGFLFSSHSSLLQSLMGELGNGYLTSDTITTLAEPDGQALFELGKKYLKPKEVEAMTRESLTGYASASVLIEALKGCGRDVTTDCVVQQLENTSNLKTLAMGPISFGKGVRFSNQKTRVIKNDFPSRTFVAVTPYE